MFLFVFEYREARSEEADRFFNEYFSVQGA